MYIWPDTTVHIVDTAVPMMMLCGLKRKDLPEHDFWCYRGTARLRTVDVKMICTACTQRAVQLP